MRNECTPHSPEKKRNGSKIFWHLLALTGAFFAVNFLITSCGPNAAQQAEAANAARIERNIATQTAEPSSSETDRFRDANLITTTSEGEYLFSCSATYIHKEEVERRDFSGITNIYPIYYILGIEHCFDHIKDGSIIITDKNGTNTEYTFLGKLQLDLVRNNIKDTNDPNDEPGDYPMVIAVAKDPHDTLAASPVGLSSLAENVTTLPLGQVVTICGHPNGIIGPYCETSIIIGNDGYANSVGILRVKEGFVSGTSGGSAITRFQDSMQIFGIFSADTMTDVNIAENNGVVVPLPPGAVSSIQSFIQTISDHYMIGCQTP